MDTLVELLIAFTLGIVLTIAFVNLVSTLRKRRRTGEAGSFDGPGRRTGETERFEGSGRRNL